MCQNRTSPTPSPLKKRVCISSAPRPSPAIAGKGREEADDDDDEETLQLQLKALEARLKLKRLQQKKLKTATAATDRQICANDRRTMSINSSVNERPQDYGDNKLLGTEVRQPSAVQVMVSPQKRIVAQEARSPGRVLLGIDKGLKGKNISLKRPPTSQNKKDSIGDDPFRSRPERGDNRHISDTSVEDRHGRSKTFSEKMAEIRQQDKEHKERSNRLRQSRSTGFGIPQSELDGLKKAASMDELKAPNSAENAVKGVRFSREEILQAVNKPTGGLLGRSRTISSMQTSQHRENSSSAASIPSKYPIDSSQNPRHASSIVRTRSTTPPTTNKKPSNSTLNDDPLFEHFSCVQLTKRLIPHNFLVDTFTDKHISHIPSLLATIKSPTYELPPALENDFVVLGIIASKSSPLSHKDAHKSTDPSSSTYTSLAEATDSAMNARGKYMVFTLTDLKWTLDLYLFTTAYTQFWKLTPGTLIAILNPSIMPPPPGKADTGRFSLVLNSSDDTILEIGTSRDLGWCKSVRKDGKVCGSWVDKRRTEFCEWHVDRVVETTRRGRMEVNGMSAPYAPGGKRGGRTGFWGGRSRKTKEAASGKENMLLKEGAQWDRSISSRYFIAPSINRSLPGRSAASLLDAETIGGIGIGGGAEERGGSREERMRKRLAEQEREREIARQLGEGGNGIGSEYLKIRRENYMENERNETGNNSVVIGGDSGVEGSQKLKMKMKLGAEALGLKGIAENIKLGSIRVRKRVFGRMDDEGGEDADDERKSREREKGRENKRLKIEKGNGKGNGKEKGEGGGESVSYGNDDDDDDDDGLDIV